MLLVAAGLVRPEAWLLPPLLALAGDRRNLRAAIAWGVAAPGLWLVFDGLLLGDPLLAFHRTDALAGIAAPGPGLAGVVRLVWFATGFGILVAWLGARRLWATDALPGLVLAAVPVALLAELAVGYPVRERYALLLVPAVAGAAGSLARFTGHLKPVAAGIGVVLALALAGGHDVVDRRLPLTLARAQAAAIDDRLPDCARIGVAGLGIRTPGLLPPLAVLTGRPLSRASCPSRRRGRSTSCSRRRRATACRRWRRETAGCSRGASRTAASAPARPPTAPRAARALVRRAPTS